MSKIKLTEPKDVIEVLGGVSQVAAISGYRAKAVWNWTDGRKLPSKTFLILSAALAEKGYDAPPSFWGIIGPEMEKAS